MSAPLAAAHFIPAAMSLVLPWDPFMTLTSRIWAFQSRPVVAIELLAEAPMSPAMKVPWLVLYWLVCPRPHPGTRVIFPSRSGCWSSMPLSTTAMSTSSEPLVISHASAAPIASKCHGISYGRHPAKQGSFGFKVADSATESGALVSKAKRWLGERQISVIAKSNEAALFRTLGFLKGL